MAKNKVMSQEEIIETLREQVVDYRQEIAALESARLDLDETIQQHEATITNLRQLVDTYRGKRDERESFLDEQDETIQKHEATISNLRGMVAWLINLCGQAGHEEKIALIESETDMARRLYTLEEGIKNRDERIESQATKIKELKKLIGETNSKLVGLHRLFDKIEEV